MIAIFIPFFLAARIFVEDNSWRYGPEYMFEVHVNTSASLKAQNDVEMGTFLVADLSCRPKLMNSLVCRLSNATAWNFGDETSSEEEKEFDVNIIDDSFEVVFNNRGVESLIIDRNMFTYRLNMIRSIVDQLSIGADLNSKPDQTFRSKQNFTVGECDVHFKVHHYPSKSVIRKVRSRIYDLESLAQLNKLPGETVNIEKTKNLNNCTRYAPYYFGAYGENTVVNEKFQTHLLSSVSRIRVSDSSFVSTTMNTGTVASPKRKKIFSVTEIINMTLKGIQAAEAQLPEIPNLGRTSVIANSAVDEFISISQV